MADFGAWSLLPPALAIAVAIVTRRVYQSLLLGIFVAGVMVAGAATLQDGWLLGSLGALAGGIIQTVEWIVLGIADEYHAAVLAFTLFLGALVALLQRSGAVRGFGEAAIRYAATKRRGQALAWGVGAAFLAIDDYFHVIAAGAIFRPMTDRLRISREKLAYIIDSTAAPMVILVPFSTWVGVILSTTGGFFDDAGYADRTPFAVFLQGLPFNFYAILTVAFVGVVALTRIEYGPMRTAERRAELEGRLLRDGAKPLMSRELAEMEALPGARPRALNLILPVLFLFASALTMLFVTGYNEAAGNTSFFEALQNARAELSLAIASFLTLLFAMVLYGLQGILKQDEYMDTAMEGFKAMVPALAILALAWGIGNAVGGDGVGLGDWISGAVGDAIAPATLPLLAFLLSAVIAFSTGTSFGTFAIMIPVTLGTTLGSPDAGTWLGPVLAATLGGAVFGDHCSPISDTTVMSSMAGHCDHIDHVRTQLPYALTVALVAVAGYGALALTGEPWIAWVANLVLFAAVFGAAWLIGGILDRRATRSAA